jgi:hypothetical protein
VKNFKLVFILFFAIIYLIAVSQIVYADKLPSVTISGSAQITAGDTAEFDISIQSEGDINKVSFFVNGEFYTVVYNCEKDFKFFYPVSSDAPGGTAEIKAEATCSDGTGSGTALLTVNANSPTEINFEKLDPVVNYNEFNSISAIIMDNDGIADVKLYINGSLSAASFSVEGDLYTFSDFEKNAGDMKFEIKVTDTNGAVTSAETKVVLQQFYKKVLMSNDMSSTYNTGGDFKLSEEGYSFSLVDDGEGKCLQIKRTSLVTSTKNPYIRYQMNSREGVLELGFDMKLNEGFENTGLYIDLRGTLAEPVTPRITGGDITFKNGAADETVQNVFTADEWYKCKYICDTNKGTYCFAVGDNEYSFDLPLGAGGKTGPILYLAMYFVLPDENDAIQIDNLYFTNEAQIGQINSVEYTDECVLVDDGGAFDKNSLDGKIIICSDEEEIEITGISRNADNKLVLIPKKNLSSSIDYLLEIKEGAKNTEGFAVNGNVIKDFKTNADDFDVVKLDFYESADSLGATATIANNTDEAKTVLMIFTLKDENGAVQSVISSETVSVMPGGTNVCICPPVYSENMSAEVFFLSNWTDNTAIKKYIFKH